MTIKKEVEKLLNTNKKLRNSDNNLLLSYWKMYDQGKAITPAMSIIRSRQSLNAVGKYLPTDPEVLKHRGFKEEAMRKALIKGEVV